MITFRKIKRENIFNDNFLNFEENNLLDFENKNIIIIYGPNGAGKTSLAKILNSENGCEFDLSYNGRTINAQNNDLFHTIDDQNGRNYIVGETKDFLLGENIKIEYELKDRLDSEFLELFKNTLPNILKNNYYIKKKTSKLASFITDESILHYTKDIANAKSKGDNINRNSFIEYVNSLETNEIAEHNDNKFNFLIEDLNKPKSIIEKILDLSNETLIQNTEIKIVEKNTDAISILEKFPNVSHCIVCDNTICVEEKLELKISQKERIINVMEQQTKDIIESLLKIVRGSDPFNLKEILLRAIDMGDFQVIQELQNEIKSYLCIFNLKLLSSYSLSLSHTEIVENMTEYNRLIQERPILTDEDILFIEHIVNDNIDKMIELTRDNNNTLKLVLDGEEFLNKGRQALKLSNGEQNFISLAFELLKAKNIDREIIILDDPISSFDSIYKNKIAFSIIKFLSNKKQVVLTHNIELIRLLEHQKQNCFKLYLLNTTEGESNGFFSLSSEEMDLVLYIHKLINFFRADVANEILNERSFLISMIPFMRGYAQLLFDSESINSLTQLMHGYNNSIQNVSEIYNRIFGSSITFTEEHNISAQDIINFDIDNLAIFNDNSTYKLLEKTLKHSLIYLNLRLKVEKILVDTFSINTRRYSMLSQIIFKAYSGNNIEVIKKRAILASKKTLLNEFNHFEGNMNIFQPAIDITDTALEAEKNSILEFLENV